MAYAHKAYCKDIFIQFKVYEEPRDAAILFSGFPMSSNDERDKINYFYKLGYNTFHITYRGSFQSKGLLFEKNPVDDLEDVVNFLKKGKLTELYNLEEIKFENKKIILSTGSAGGAFACALAGRIKPSKVLMFAPVFDWQAQNENGDEEDIISTMNIVERAYQNIYRLKTLDLQKQLNIKELNPKNYIKKIKNIPMLIYHDPKDEVVAYRNSEKWTCKLPLAKLKKHKYGHGSWVALNKKKRTIKKFLRK